MANIHTYDRGVEFDLSTWANLSSEWAWEGRTLSCFYIKSNDYPELSAGKMVELGSKMMLSGDYNNISGIWLMNKSQYPVKIYLIGPDDGGVSVTLSERNTQYPIGSTSQPFFKKHETFTNLDVDQETRMVSTEVYYQKGSWYDIKNATYIALSVAKSDNTTVTNINWGNESYTGVSERSIFWPEPSRNDTYRCNWEGQSNSTDQQTLFNSFLNKGLSVYFSTQGYLSYNKNDTYVNPKGTQT